MSKRKFLTKDEKDYIQQNCISKTDEEIASYLDRDIKTIAAFRIGKLGIKKDGRGNIIQPVPQQGGAGNTIPTNANTGREINPHISLKLTEQQRKNFFKTQLKNSLFYDNLKQQFAQDEIDFYLEEWGSLCVQFEDVLATEKRQIDELIKAEVMGNRILRNIKITEEEVRHTIARVEEWRKANDVKNDEEAQERDDELMAMIRMMYSMAQGMSTEYQKNVDLRNQLLNELNARRRDRIDQIKKGSTTFIGLVQQFRDREMRETHGRNLELVKMAKEKKLNEWRVPKLLPDGSRDCILLDDKSTLPKKNIARYGSSIVDRYSNERDKAILIIENDNNRLQFFLDKFKNNKIDMASNCEKALEKLNSTKYDLICFDYDIGLETNSLSVAQYMVQNNVCPNAFILIHSNNPSGADALENVLITIYPEVEKVSFDQIFRNHGA